MPNYSAVSLQASTEGTQRDLQVIRLGAGAYTLSAWTDVLADGSSRVMARVLSSSGQPDGDAFQISETGHNAENARIASDPQGGFVVAWQETGADGSNQLRYRNYAGAPMGTTFTAGSVQTLSEQLVGANFDLYSDGVSPVMIAARQANNLGQQAMFVHRLARSTSAVTPSTDQISTWITPSVNDYWTVPMQGQVDVWGGAVVYAQTTGFQTSVMLWRPDAGTQTVATRPISLGGPLREQGIWYTTPQISGHLQTEDESGVPMDPILRVQIGWMVEEYNVRAADRQSLSLQIVEGQIAFGTSNLALGSAGTSNNWAQAPTIAYVSGESWFNFTPELHATLLAVANNDRTSVTAYQYQFGLMRSWLGTHAIPSTTVGNPFVAYDLNNATSALRVYAETNNNLGDVVRFSDGPAFDALSPVMEWRSPQRLIVTNLNSIFSLPLDGGVLAHLPPEFSSGVNRLEITASFSTGEFELGLVSEGSVSTSLSTQSTRDVYVGAERVGTVRLNNEGLPGFARQITFELLPGVSAAAIAQLIQSVGVRQPSASPTQGGPGRADVSISLIGFSTDANPPPAFSMTRELNLTRQSAGDAPSLLDGMHPVTYRSAADLQHGVRIDSDVTVHNSTSGFGQTSVSIYSLRPDLASTVQLGLMTDQGSPFSIQGEHILLNGHVVGRFIDSAPGQHALQIQLLTAAPPSTAEQLIEWLTYRNPAATSGLDDHLVLTIGDSNGGSDTQLLTIVSSDAQASALTDQARRLTINSIQADVTALEGSQATNFAIAYDDNGQVWAQRLDARNTPLGTPLQCGTNTGEPIQDLKIIAMQDGGFAVVWQQADARPDAAHVSTTSRILAQRFDAAGTPQGIDEQHPNGTVQTLYLAQGLGNWPRSWDIARSGAQGLSLVISVAAPGLIIGAEDLLDADDGWTLQRSFDTQGSASAWHVITADQAGGQSAAQLLNIDASQQVIAYQQSTLQSPQGERHAVWLAQRMGADGSLAGPAIDLQHDGAQLLDLASDSLGGFVAAFATSTAQGADNDLSHLHQIWLQQVNAQGQLVGAHALAASWRSLPGTRAQPTANLEALLDGGYVLTWIDALRDTEQRSMLQRFDANLTAVEQPLQTTTRYSAVGGPQAPQISELANGNLATTWSNWISASFGYIAYDMTTRIIGTQTTAASSLAPRVDMFNRTTSATPGTRLTLDAASLVEDSDSPHFAGGELALYVNQALTAAQLAGSRSVDTLGLAATDQTAEGLVSVQGSQILYGSNVIGQFVTGQGITYDGQQGRDLRIALNANATPLAVRQILSQAYIEIGPESGGPAPLQVPERHRDIHVYLHDGAGGYVNQAVASIGSMVPLRIDAGPDTRLTQGQSFSRDLIISANFDWGLPGRNVYIDWGDGQSAQHLADVEGHRRTISHGPFNSTGRFAVRIVVEDVPGVMDVDTLNLEVTNALGGFELSGTANSDTLVGGSGADSLSGLGGDDLLQGLDDADALNGGDGHDRLEGGEGDDTLLGGAGNDILDGGAGLDRLEGGDGNDTYLIHQGGDQAIEYNATDFDEVIASINYRLGPNLENLTLAGSGSSEPDAELAGEGNALNNRITGNNASNWIRGHEGDDRIEGMGGNDSLAGDTGSDILIGGEGNDALDGGEGPDQMVGGAGDDLYIVSEAADQIVETESGGVDTVRANGDYVLYANLENLVLLDGASNGSGNPQDNWMQGNGAGNWMGGGAGNDAIYGLGGNDSLNGDDGDDLLYGGDGDDVVDGGAGRDQMYGGAGDDRYIIRDANDEIYEDADGGVDTVDVYVDNYVPFANTENIRLAGSTLSASGNAANNWMEGNAGNNFLGGGDGHDRLIGFAGDDWLQGDAGADVLEGGDGNDTLFGGVGVDTLIGGDGNDVYYVDGPGDTIIEAPTGGIDTVYSSGDFTLTGNLENLVITGTQDVYGHGDAGSNWMQGNEGANAMSGFGGDDYIDGQKGDDLIDGGDGDDILVGGEGNDVIRAGTGKDEVFGGLGADRYEFYAGDQGLTIHENDTDTASIDQLMFDEGIDKHALWLVRQEDDLLIIVNNSHASQDSVLIRAWFLGEERRVEEILDGNHEKLRASQVTALVEALASSGVDAPVIGTSFTTDQQQALDLAIASSW